MSESVPYDPASLASLLPTYYRRLFPFKPYYNWLSYGQSECIRSDWWINRSKPLAEGGARGSFPPPPWGKLLYGGKVGHL